MNFDQFPAVFRYISIDDFINVFLGEPAITQIVDLIFDRVTKSLHDVNINMLNNLLELLDRYETVDGAHQEILLDIADIAVVQLSKNKKAKEFFDKFRFALLKIIKSRFAGQYNRQEDVPDKFILKTLPAFVTILKTVVARNSADIDEQLVNVTKEYLKHSVSGQQPETGISDFIKQILSFTAGRLCKSKFGETVECDPE